MLLNQIFGRLALTGKSQTQSHNLVNIDPFSELIYSQISNHLDISIV